MRVVVRADASFKIGSGHVMRTATLADSLRSRGAEVVFISREHAGNLNDFLEKLKGYRVLRLEPSKEYNSQDPAEKDSLSEENWLGVSWQEDCSEAKQKIKELYTRINPVDWLVVDHYSLDTLWESSLREWAHKVMVVDDLANREHDADLLLDQNLYEDSEKRYDGLVQNSCRMLVGPRFALLRPEFLRFRNSLPARGGGIRRIMIFFGGSDPTNETIKALKALVELAREGIASDVVVGASNPNRDKIQEFCRLQSRINYHFNVENMAQLMSKADLFIGSGGTSTWERCCLGLPSITIAVAKNQEEISKAISDHGAGVYLGTPDDVDDNLLYKTVKKLMKSPEMVREMSEKSRSLVDGLGAQRVADILCSMSGRKESS